MTWQAAINAWVQHLRAAGRRAQTIVLYQHYANHVADELAHASPWAVTAGQLEQVLARSGGGPSARKSLVTVLRGFYRWALGAGHVQHDPTAALPTVRVPRGRPRPTPEGVLAEVLQRANERERLMVELGAFAGLRAGEISRVHARDFDGDMLLVHGKGGHERLVPIPGGHLQRALTTCDGWLFPNVQRGSHLTPNHVSKILSALLPAPWTAHTLRHRFGTRAYAGTRDLLAVSKLLGHASPETTLIYVQLPDDHLRTAVAAAASVGALAPAPASAAA